MAGTAIIRAQLAANATLTATVPATRIMAGILPRGTTLPAIALSKVSGKQANNLAMSSSSYLMSDRVQVTVLSANYPQLQSLIEAVRDALPLSRGTVNGFECEGIIPDSEGPDLFDHDQQVWSQSLDFMVSWIRST